MEALANAAHIFTRNHGKVEQLRQALAEHDAAEAPEPEPEPAPTPKPAAKAKAKS